MCPLAISLLLQFILKHKFVWACVLPGVIVSANPRLPLLSPHPPRQ